MNRQVAVCIGCGCDDNHACEFGCYWLRVDREDRKGVCSECVDHCEAWDKGDRTSRAQSIAEMEAEWLEEMEASKAIKPEKPNPGITPCPHDWPRDQPEMSDCCRWCGMSFTRHVYTEMP